MDALQDRLGRPLGNLRLSVTDRCNLRCAYCMPEEDYRWLARADLLTFEEIVRLAGVFQGLGVDKLRLTGGEPLLRRDLDRLVSQLARLPGIHDLALTTNGLLLAGQAAALRAAGLHRITVSLDTLRPERFRALTRRDGLADVLAGIRALGEMGFEGTKLDAVILRGVNDDELFELLRFAGGARAELRFIEYMDVGGATRWNPEAVVTRQEILERIGERHGPLTPLPRGSAPAERFCTADGATFGVIASTTTPFCGVCDRSRLTADGRLYTCLYANQGLDLLGPLRRGASDAQLAELIAARWRGRTDRGAEERLAEAERGPSVERTRLWSDPRLEMHTRGG